MKALAIERRCLILKYQQRSMAHGQRTNGHFDILNLNMLHLKKKLNNGQTKPKNILSLKLKLNPLNVIKIIVNL